MPAPKGNQYALGNNGGRPREVSWEPEDMIDLGKEMVEWVKEHKPLHLSEWYTIEMMFTYQQWKAFTKCKEFRPYYEKSLKLVGLQYLDKESRIRDGISQRWQRVYFKDLADEENERSLYEAEIKKKAFEDVTLNLSDYKAWLNESKKPKN